MPTASSLRALVVEDEWPARNYLVELIESSGLATVAGAVGGTEEARQALGRDPPGVRVDVAFVDVQLANGGEARSVAHSRVFIATGWST
jgi:CheY-like chemotaxis protein